MLRLIVPALGLLLLTACGAGPTAPTPPSETTGTPVAATPAPATSTPAPAPTPTVAGPTVVRVFDVTVIKSGGTPPLASPFRITWLTGVPSPWDGAVTMDAFEIGGERYYFSTYSKCANGRWECVETVKMALSAPGRTPPVSLSVGPWEGQSWLGVTWRAGDWIVYFTSAAGWVLGVTA